MSELIDPGYVDVTLRLFTNVIGVQQPSQFEFALLDEAGGTRQVATNDPVDGSIRLTHRFTDAGQFHWSVKAINIPANWEVVRAEFPVHISIVAHPVQGTVVAVNYPQGIPGFQFRNTAEDEPCSRIEFPEVTFDKPGLYKYKIHEMTPSGGGWHNDGELYEVIVRVEDDGYGNLVATVEYPEGFPVFTNTYKAEPVRVVISGRKRAVGADLPCGRFEFGLYDEDDQLVSTTRNE